MAGTTDVGHGVDSHGARSRSADSHRTGTPAAQSSAARDLWALIKEPDEGGVAASPAAGLTGRLVRLRRRRPPAFGASDAAGLRQLADALDGAARGEPVDGWSELDLIAQFGGAQARLRWPAWVRTLLDDAPAVLVFLPIVATWIGLALAVGAYSSLEADPASRRADAGRTFLDLWQSGFGGRLPGLFDFTAMAVFISAVVSVLIIMTLCGAWLSRSQEQDTAQLDARLRPILRRAQIEMNRRRLESPVRFAGELSRASVQLGDLLGRTNETHAAAARLAVDNSRAASELRGSTAELTKAVGSLRGTGREVSSAAKAMTVASTELTASVAARADEAAQRMDTASADASRKVGELHRTGKEALDAVTRRFEESLSGVRDQVAASLEQLADAAREHAETVGDSSQRAAESVGRTYQEAVASAAVTLVQQMTGASDQLNRILAQMGESAAEHTEAARTTSGAATAHATAFADAVNRLERTIAGYTHAQRDHTTSVADSVAQLAVKMDRLAGELEHSRREAAAAVDDDVLQGADAEEGADDTDVVEDGFPTTRPSVSGTENPPSDPDRDGEPAAD